MENDERRPAEMAGLTDDMIELMSIEEIDARISDLRAQIERLRAAREAKGHSRQAAESFFKS